MDWKIFAWLRRGKRRLAVLKIFGDSNGPLTTNDVKTKSKIAISQASATIKELTGKELIECLNSEDKIGKLYRITKLGKECLDNIRAGGYF